MLDQTANAIFDFTGEEGAVVVSETDWEALSVFINNLPTEIKKNVPVFNVLPIDFIREEGPTISDYIH